MLRVVRRNTELGLILLGTLVTVGAYLLASLAQDATIPANIGPFLGVVLGLQLAAHLAIRRLAPDADGTLLPIAGLLNGIGYVFIARLDEAKVAPAGPGRPAGGLDRGRASSAFIVTLLVVRRVRDLERYRCTIGFAGIGLLLLPLVPGRRPPRSTAPGSGSGIGPVSFQPGEFAKILLALFFASYLVEKRELLAVSSFRVGPIVAARPQAPRPGAARLGRVARGDGLGEGPRQLAAVLRPVRGAALGGHRAGAYLRRRVWSSSAPARCSPTAQFGHVQERVDIWLDPWQDPKDDGFQIVESPFAFAAGGVTGTGIDLGQPHPHPLRGDRLHLRGHRRGARACSAPPASSSPSC